MFFYGFLAILILAIGLYVYFLYEEKIETLNSENNPPPFRTHKSVLSKAELRFYKALVNQVNENHVILPKVSMQEIFYITKGTGEMKAKAKSKIAGRHTEFLVCDKEALTPSYAIVLDYSRHISKNRKRSDRYIDRVHTAAGLPLIHIKVKREYTQQDFYDLPSDTVKEYISELEDELELINNKEQ